MKQAGFLRVLTRLESRIQWTARRLQRLGISPEDVYADFVFALWRASLAFEDEEHFLNYASAKLKYLQTDQLRGIAGRSREAPETLRARAGVRYASDDNLLQVTDGTPWPDAELHRKRLLSAIEDALPHLSPRERHILLSVYRENKAQREIAKEMGVSEPYISQIRLRAERKIRESIELKWRWKS